MNTDDTNLRKIIEKKSKYKSRRIMREYPSTLPPPANPNVKSNFILDAVNGALDFIFNGKIDFKKDDNGIHLKIDKDPNK